MFRRLIAGLVSPKKTVEYANDKWYMPLLCLLFMAIIYAIPVVIFASNQSILDYDTTSEIRIAFKQGDTVNYKIENGLITTSYTSEDITIIDSDVGRFVFTNTEIDKSSLNENGYNFIFQHETIKVVVKASYFNTYSVIRELKVSDFTSLEGLDFSKAHSDDKDFWSKVFLEVETLLDSYRFSYISLSVLMNVGTYLLEILIVALIVGLLMKMQTSIPFGTTLKLAIYISTPIMVGTLLSVLYSFSFLGTIGFIITFIYGMIISFNVRVTGGKNV